MSFSSLPIIDLRDDESSIVRVMRDACSTTGFFYLRNHNLDESQRRMFALSQDFFRLPLQVKEEHLITEDNHGYVRRGQENLSGTSTNIIDEKEAFNIGKRVQSDNLPAIFARADNFQLITEFQRDCYQLCMRLLEYLARGFEIDVDYFTSRHKWELDSADTLRLLHYPAVREHSDTSIRAGAHSDYGSLTLLFQHLNQSGLEVLDRSSNTWHPVAPYEDMLVVNFGDAFEYWSKGFIKSTVHRVAMPVLDPAKENERFSIAYFCHPNNETLLTPVPSRLIRDRVYEKDAHAKQALEHDNENSLTAGEHFQMRISQTYTY